jgi:hypothetical protein
MSSPLMAILVIAPIAALVSLSASMYKWEQQHLEAENLAEEYIYTCRKATYGEIHLSNINKIPRDQLSKMAKVLSSCDDHMLYYKGRCELDSPKLFCSNSALEGYLILRGLKTQKDQSDSQGLSIQLR